MIRIYPSKLPGEPLETHHHGATTLHQWLVTNVENYDPDRCLLTAELNGEEVPPEAWPQLLIDADSDVKIFPSPAGANAAAWISLAVSAVSLIASFFLLSQKPEVDSSAGRALGLTGTKAVQSRPGDPVREVFGRCRVYPDYIVQPVTRFSKDDPSVMVTHMFVCIGAGRYSFGDGDISVGETPVMSEGLNVSYKVYGPGWSVVSDERSENWYNAPEVGASSGGSGLDMGTTAPSTNSVDAESLTVGYSTVTVNGTSSNGDSAERFWKPGQLINLRVPADVEVTVWQNEVTGWSYTTICGDVVSEIAPYRGMPVTVETDINRWDLWVAEYSPAKSAVGDTPAAPARLALTWDSAGKSAFTSLPTGKQRLSVDLRGAVYRVERVSGNSIGVKRMKDGEADQSWTGFSPRTAFDYEASGLTDNGAWLGPFIACPACETTDCIEVNFAFPGGICGYNEKGKKKSRTVDIEVQWRTGGGEWSSKSFSYSRKTVNGIGFTERITLNRPSEGAVEVRVRRKNEQGSDNARDSAYWHALRTRLTTRPDRYNDITCMGVSVECGGRLAAQSDRKLSVIATRLYDRGEPRSISGALYHLLSGCGLDDDDIDTATIDEMERVYWTPRGEKFDLAATDSKSAFEIFRQIAEAGNCYPLIDAGRATVGRDGVKPWTTIFTPEEMTGPLTVSFTFPTDDDFKGVDVTYVDELTFSEETLPCRYGDTRYSIKTEQLRLYGVTNRVKAWRAGMRRAMKNYLSRTKFQFETEMDALVCRYGDRVILTDDIPYNDDGAMTATFFITGMTTTNGITRFVLSESRSREVFEGGSINSYSDSVVWRPFWFHPGLLGIIRYQDGSISEMLKTENPNTGDSNYFTVFFKHRAEFDGIVTDNAAEEPAKLILFESRTVPYDAVITSIEPDGEGRCKVTAEEYNERYYENDDLTEVWGPSPRS